MFDGNDNEPVELTINKSYAKKYEHWREKEEKQKRKFSLVERRIELELDFCLQWSLGTAVISKKIRMKKVKTRRAK